MWGPIICLGPASP